MSVLSFDTGSMIDLTRLLARKQIRCMIRLRGFTDSCISQACPGGAMDSLERIEGCQVGLLPPENSYGTLSDSIVSTYVWTRAETFVKIDVLVKSQKK